MKKLIFLGTMLTLLIVLPVWAQEVDSPPSTKIYEVKWRNAQEIARLLDGFPIIRNMSVSQAFNTITITTADQGHAAISELLKKYDTPPKKIELQFYLIRASSTGEGIKNGLPEKIHAVIEEIAALTRYQSFEMLDTPVLHATEGRTASVSGKGSFFYTLDISKPVAIVENDEGLSQIRIEQFYVRFSIPTGYREKPFDRQVGVETSFQIGDGETIVVGASQIQSADKGRGPAIITVVTANILGVRH